MMVDFYQYALWTNCNNNCKFCLHLGKSKLSTSQMCLTLHELYDLIDAGVNNCVDISFIGGEIFDDQLDDAIVRAQFYRLLELCAQKYKIGCIRRLMVCTSLIFDVNKHLIQFIQQCNRLGLSDILMLCTSYDTIYRFHTDVSEKLWKDNMVALQKLLRNKIHTEIILTHDLIQKSLSGKFDVLGFQNAFNTHIDFIEPTYVEFYGSKQHSLHEIPKFFPTRNEFLQYVKHMCILSHIIDIRWFLNIYLRSKYVFFRNHDGKWIMVEDKWKSNCRRFDENGKVVRIYTYSDTDDVTMIDDIENIKNTLVF